MLQAPMKHCCLLLLLLGCHAGWANPLVATPPAEQVITMTSEKLQVMLHPNHADLDGQFTFAALSTKSGESAVKVDTDLELEIPIWIPSAAATTTPAIRQALALFPEDYTFVGREKSIKLVDEVIRLRGTYGTNILKRPQLISRESTGTRGYYVHRFHPGETVCLIWTYQISSRHRFCAVPLKLQYRQPLAGTNGVGIFFYEPILSPQYNATTANQKGTHQITFVTATNCVAEIVCGRVTNRVASGKQYALTPRNGEGITALVRAAKAK